MQSKKRDVLSSDFNFIFSEIDAHRPRISSLFLYSLFWQAKPRPPDKPGSLALVKDRINHREVECTPPRVPTVLGNVRALLSSFRRRLLGRELWPHSSLNRRNYRDGCPGDPAKAIGSELAGASLQAQEEKVSGFLFFIFLYSL